MLAVLCPLGSALASERFPWLAGSREAGLCHGSLAIAGLLQLRPHEPKEDVFLRPACLRR